MNDIFRRQVKTLKQALYDTIHHHPKLSVEAMAEQLGMTTSYLYRAATLDPDTEGPDVSGVRFPLKQLTSLIRVTGDFQVIDLLEFQLGRVAIPIDQPDDISTKDRQEAALNAVVHFGDMIKTYHQAISDGKITEKEQAMLDGEAREALQAIMILIRKQS